MVVTISIAAIKMLDQNSITAIEMAMEEAYGGQERPQNEGPITLDII